MAQRFTFPQSGDADDAEHFASLIGHDNLANYVAEGIQLTPDYTVPEVSVTTGKAFIQTASETASSSGDTILKTNYVIQIPAQTVSLADATTNYVYLQPDLSTDDNGFVSAFTSQQGGDSLLLAVIDTSADTIDRRNRNPDGSFGSIRLGDDEEVLFGNGEDYAIEYDSTNDVLSVEDANGNDLIHVSDGSVQFFNDITDGTNTIYDASNDWIPQERLENDSLTVSAGTDLTGGGLVSLGGSTTLNADSGSIRASASDSGSLVLSGPTDFNFDNNINVSDDGDGTITIDSIDTDTDTHTDISENGGLVVSDTTDINFSNNLSVTDDGDGSVTIDSTDTNTDTRTDVSGNGSLVVSDTTDINFSNNLSVTNDGDGSVTIDAASATDTRTDVSGSGSLVVSDTTDINFASNLNVSDDGDGSVTVNAQSSTDTTTDLSQNGSTVVTQTGDINFTSSGAATVNVSGDGDGTGSVNVDATDTNTTYSAGNALNLSGTQFNVNEGGINHDNISGVSSGDHHSKTSSASELSDVSADSVSGAHHSRYSDNEAVTAVNNETSLSVDITGDADTVDGQDANDIGVGSSTYGYGISSSGNDVKRINLSTKSTSSLSGVLTGYADSWGGNDGYIYAWEGGSTRELDRYDISADSWTDNYFSTADSTFDDLDQWCTENW
jgi:hypothetical protein